MLMNFSKGDIWLYKDRDCKKHFKEGSYNSKCEYENREEYKIRPCILIASDTGRENELDATVIKLSTQITDDENDFLIADWEEIGLKQQSFARCSKIVTIRKSDLLHRIAVIPRLEYKKIELGILQYITQSFI